MKGTITGATSGSVSIVQGTKPCANIGGSTGALTSTGTFRMSVNCPNAGPTSVVLNNQTVATFNIVPGTVNTINGAVPAPTAVPTAVPTAAPTAVPTAAPTAVPTAAPTAAPPKTGMSSEDGSSSAWLFVIAGLGALALGVGGVTAIRKIR